VALADDRGARVARIPDDPGPEAGFDRQPPQDIGAEQSVLGGMLLSKDAIADVVEVLQPGDFYRPAHQAVYDCILDLYGRGEPADPITISAELQRRGELLRIGGAPYLHTLIAMVPTAANAGYYAEIVAEKAVLRRLVEAGTRIVQLGYHGAEGAEVSEVVDRAQAAIYEVSDRRATEDFVVLEELLQPTMDEIETIESRGIGYGVPTGFADLDEVTNGLHAGQMIIVAARPGVGKSTLGLDFARSCSIKAGKSSVVFSLEMSRTEIVMRLLSAEARIPLKDMRTGHMNDDAWARLARKVSEVSEAPLFVDDSPNLTMMEIRAKARRLKQRHDLALIVVDYLQLMTSGRRVESRQQEVSEFSRQLKLLAKELEVPLVAISQLNRGPEQRTDKKPMLADLRESGCLTERTRVLRADTGAEVSFGELIRSGQRPLVWALDERLRLVARPVTAVFPSGVRPVFRLTLASGRQLEATGNHPFLTVDGWLPLSRLRPGEQIGVAGRVPQPAVPRPLPEPEVVLLAQLFGVPADGADRCGARAVVPPAVFGLPDAQVALYLRHLWAADGAVAWDQAGDRAVISCVTAGRRFAEDVLVLLARCGVLATVRAAGDDSAGGRWVVRVEETENQLRFLDEVGARGLRCLAAKQVASRLRGMSGAGAGAVPSKVWQRVHALLHRRLIAGEVQAPRVPRQAVGAGPVAAGPVVPEPVGARVVLPGSVGAMAAGTAAGMRHSPLAQARAVLDEAELDLVAVNDVGWDEVITIEPIGEQPVFDATVAGAHNFVANGVCVHNSLEQDADMVILIHRPDAWERDDPRAGEADLILAKHRNGPMATVTVAHQLHYSRFADMAQG
jgi:replicative DNA helicase